MNAADTLKQQLNAEKALLGLNYGLIDAALTDNAAAFLAEQGVTNLRQLARLSTLIQSAGVVPPSDFADYDVNVMTGTPIIWVNGHFDDGQTRYVPYALYTADGYPIIAYSRSHIDSGGFLTSALTGLGPWSAVIGIALSFAIPGAAAAIGEAVLGPATAAAYPALSAALGNAAIGTALDGGDVSKGIQGAALGFAGGAVGGTVGNTLSDATNSALAGQLGAAATKALITGGDPKSAVIASLASTGAQSMDDFFSDSSGTDPSAYDLSVLDTPATDAVAPPDANAGNLDPFALTDGASVSTGYTVPAGSFSIPPETPATDAGSATLNDDGSVSVPGGDSGSIGSLTQLATAALQVIKVWQQGGRQSISTPGVVRTSSGSVIAPAKNGTVITTTAQGQITTSQMPVGKPYLFSDGTVVTNNGDGTYTTVSPNGSTVIAAYSGGVPAYGAHAVNAQTLLLLGVGALALFAALR